MYVFLLFKKRSNCNGNIAVTGLIFLFLPSGQTLQGLNMCLLVRQEEGGLSLVFTTGYSCTYKKNWVTLITKATVSQPILLRYNTSLRIGLLSVYICNHSFLNPSCLPFVPLQRSLTRTNTSWHCSSAGRTA